MVPFSPSTPPSFSSTPMEGKQPNDLHLQVYLDSFYITSYRIDDIVASQFPVFQALDLTPGDLLVFLILLSSKEYI
jgi:hypothetical protein